MKKSNGDNEELQKKIGDYEIEIKNLKKTAENTSKTYALKESLAKQGVLDPDYLIYKAGGLDKFTFDKEGKPCLLYTSDICDRKEQYPEIVEYRDGDWTLDYSYVSHKERGACYCNLGFYAEERKCVEVIGNIFDNPELLEVQE